MKTVFLLTTILFSTIIGITPAHAEDLLSGQNAWPTQSRQREPLLRSNEERGTILGAGIGLLVGSAVDKKNSAVAGTIIGAATGNWLGYRSDTRQVSGTSRMTEGQYRCKELYASRTDMETGGNYAQNSMNCVREGYRQAPMQEITNPAPAVYGKRPASSLSPEEQKILDEYRAKQKGETLTDEEREMLKKFREMKSEAPTAPESDRDGEKEKAHFTKVSTRGCQLFVNGVVNPDC